MFFAYDYLKTHVSMFEADYPYTGSDDNCVYDASKGGVQITGYTMIKPNDPNELLKAVTAGPTAVAVEAGQAAF